MAAGSATDDSLAGELRGEMCFLTVILNEETSSCRRHAESPHNVQK